MLLYYIIGHTTKGGDHVKPGFWIDMYDRTTNADYIDNNHNIVRNKIKGISDGHDPNMICLGEYESIGDVNKAIADLSK